MWKKGLVLLLAGMISFSVPAMSVYATENTAQTAGTEGLTEEEKAIKTQEEVWQKIYDTAPETDAIQGWPEGPKIWAEGAILMEMNSGAILYEKSSEQKFYPASITKLLTALVALENAKLTDVVTASDSSYDGMDGTYASLGLKSGEQMSMEDALYGLLFASANEVGHAIAESATEGGYDDFISKMNEKVTELGGINSNFVNTNGIHDENHYTCAYDMALIGSAVYQMEEFRQIESNLIHDIPATNLSEARIGITQHDKMMLPENSHYYEYIKAGKTGYTDAAKSTLVSMADNGTLQLVCVDLANGKALIYDDTQAMCEYGFNNFKKLSLKESETSDKIDSFADEAAYVVVPNEVTFEDLDSKIEMKEEGEKRAATISYTYQNQLVGKADIMVSKSYYKEVVGEQELELGSVEEQETSHFSIWKVLLIIIALLLVLVVVFFIWARARRKRIARERRRRAMQRRRMQQGQGRPQNQRRDERGTRGTNRRIRE